MGTFSNLGKVNNLFPFKLLFLDIYLILRGEVIHHAEKELAKCTFPVLPLTIKLSSDLQSVYFTQQNKSLAISWSRLP